MLKSAWFWLTITLLSLAALTALGPAEKTLGNNVRVVYLHGAWVWTALASFIAAALLGLAGLVTRRLSLQTWSQAWGRTGLLFWILYLPLSIWAMQTNWNGMFLAEPRFRVAVVFAIGGLLLQLGVAITEDPAWASAANVLYAVALTWVLASTPNVMHPTSPILNSDSLRIQIYYFGLVALNLLLAWQVARLWLRADQLRINRYEGSKVRKSVI